MLPDAEKLKLKLHTH